MTYEIKHTHQELSELQENTDKLLNSGTIYMNKIRLKNISHYHHYSFKFLVAPGFCCCTWAFSSCSKQALFFFVDSRFLYAWASLIVENRL